MTREEKRAAFLAKQRAISAANNEARGLPASYDPHAKPKRARRKRVDTSPAYGSAEWCETQGDNLGESPDQ